MDNKGEGRVETGERRRRRRFNWRRKQINGFICFLFEAAASRLYGLFLFTLNEASAASLRRMG